MSFLEKIADKITTAFSPRRAWINDHYRKLKSDPNYRAGFYALLALRGYRSAKSPQTATSWAGKDGSADSHILNDLPRLRSRMREINRDDPIGSGLWNTFLNNVIGSGIIPQANLADVAQNNAIEEIYYEYADTLTPVEMMTASERQRLLFGKFLEDGEIFIKRTLDSGRKLWLEIIEADRVLEIKKDAAGIPSSYRVSDGIGKERNIPANEIKHLKRATRPGQTRGVPFFHAILQDLRELDLLLLASLKRTQVAACLSVFIKSNNTMGDIFQSHSQKPDNWLLDDTIEPGGIFKLAPGEDISTLVPNFPTPELDQFIVAVARRIGAAVGVSWQIVLKDFSSSTYSSARTDLLEARQTYTTLQKWFIENYLMWEWQMIMEDAILRGDKRVTKETMNNVTWIAPGWRWVDPVKEADGAKIELEMGTTTLRDICASQGKDWQEIQAQRLLEIKQEKEKRAAMGISKAEDKKQAAENDQASEGEPK